MSALLAVTFTLAGWQIALIASVLLVLFCWLAEPAGWGRGLFTIALFLILLGTWSGYLVARILG